MKKYIFIVCISWGVVFSQDPLNGIVQYQENNKTHQQLKQNYTSEVENNPELQLNTNKE